MKTDYHEKREARIDRLKGLAFQNTAEAQAAYERSNKIASYIPFGQPILVGHHSEKRHRSDVAKIHNAMSKSVEASKKADHYADKAEAAENNTAISSDNPDAVKLLEEKLEKLIKKQEFFKAVNKIIKAKKLDEAQKLEALEKLGYPSAIKLLTPDFCGRIGIPSYELTNNNGVMKNVRDRIAHLKSLEAIGEKTVQVGEVKIEVSAEKNRVQIFFPDKPSSEVRSELKSNGFRWAPSETAWQRQLSSWAVKLANDIVNKFYKNE